MNKPTAQQLSALRAELDGVHIIDDESQVTRLSRDFSWFSPVLTPQLEPYRADIVVRPKTEDEIVRTVAACAKHGVPITPRGAGSGNYGQCTPLFGGVIIDLSQYNQLVWQKGDVARVQAGMRLLDIDKATQPTGWELRCVPSTFRIATIGGLYGGGFGGIGSINYGPLASTGNVLGVKAITVEPEPKLIELRAPEALLLHHVYGTSGIVLEMEIALAPAHAWRECVIVGDGIENMLRMGDEIANSPGITKKSVTFFENEVQPYLPTLHSYWATGKNALFVVCTSNAIDALLEMGKRYGAVLSYNELHNEQVRKGKTILEYTWNHTTLHALKIDKTLTYIQSGFPAGQHIEHALKMKQLLGDECLLHLEFIRLKEGQMTFSGLQLIRYTNAARLDEIMQLHRDNGVYIANPHVYHVEDGKQGQINPDIVMTKMRLDPQGLVNPGKLRGWDVRDQIAADVKAGKVNVSTLPSF
ncbi:MAG: FAD-binding oxidoreductase [Burkholderiales bacterium]|nr:MAG: FAD-binding oxidoreductase [Burkholderiales bacterium]TAG83010.1 MAG: FAD-binding oxidoreductase [Betaproteobacteria bacterium]